MLKKTFAFATVAAVVLTVAASGTTADAPRPETLSTQPSRPDRSRRSQRPSTLPDS